MDITSPEAFDGAELQVQPCCSTVCIQLRQTKLDCSLPSACRQIMLIHKGASCMTMANQSCLMACTGRRATVHDAAIGARQDRASTTGVSIHSKGHTAK